MIYEYHKDISNPVEHATQLIATTEKQWGCRITVHDELGRFSIENRPLLPPDRQIHSHGFCTWNRYRRAGWHKACNDHCLYDMRKHVLRGGGRHSCWKGGREIVCPIFQEGTLLLTLFAGVYRGPEPEDMAPNDRWRELWQALPVLEQEEEQHLLLQLEMLGHALTSLIDTSGDGTLTRKELIRSFIVKHSHEDLSLGDLAKELGLCEGHCSREVKRLMGMPFSSYLQTERLKRAAILLRHSGLTVEEVATRVGFSDPYHFNKSFKSYVGSPPGKWRKAHT